ncbi:nucleosome assembly protein-like protein [Trypanosoma rangeli]|uniref:Nucleosome assembly protein-like protein n=1 Tax=Trypanosoma rangeli TaxID=5698 RepID=A0A3R7KHX6_TRYRA|nr:nucleosome assembly protein-like protein [Trypanosoma rangeli]RNF07980.1 nucleosome assembly protein-like protein [Trypanosoma rangeli]|eukprot:RNF07980.1 nucleosome assembly protein-like protein [Trypanosoma rangeli]
MPKFVDPVHLHQKEHEDHEEEDEEDFDLVAAMNEMTMHERRRAYALKGLLNDYRNVHAKFREELASLQVEHLHTTQQLHNVRAEIVRGLRDVTDDEIAALTVTAISGVQEIPSDDEDDKQEKGKAQSRGAAAGSAGNTAAPTKSVKVVTLQEEKGRLETAAAAADGGIPDFWLTALCNAETIESMITERDRHALSFLQDITTEYIEDDPQKGFRLNFHFAPNEYFSNTVLSKTYRLTFDEDSGEFEVDSMKATPVEWKSAEKNLTVILKKKKQRHKTSKSIRVVTREEKCPSFFTFFTDPLGDDDDEEEEEASQSAEAGKKKHKEEEEDDDDEEEEEAEAELHIEVGHLLMEEIVPKAAMFYTGKSVDQTALALQSQLNIQFLDDDDDDEDEDEEEKEEDKKIGNTHGKRRHTTQHRGGGGGGGGKEEQQCKQQ